MAPIMSSFAAGMAFGPAIGGLLADSIGLAAVNNALLVKTKPKKMTFPWRRREQGNGGPALLSNDKDDKMIASAAKNAMRQWSPLLSDAQIRNVVIMHGFYWFSLAGSQMTLLLLLLTDPNGLAMSATSVGKVYVGMSLVQVLGNPVMGKVVDNVGKGKAIVAGCSLISTSMAVLPFCASNVRHVAGALGFWALGSTVLSTAPVTYVSDATTNEQRAQGIALLRTAGDIGFLAGAAAMGALADYTGNLDVAMQASARLLWTATGWFAVRQVLKSELKKKKKQARGRGTMSKGRS